MPLVVKAPGKLMLLGEHAVIYGYPCIVTAVSRYLTVKVVKIQGQTDIIRTPGFLDNRFIIQSIKFFRHEFPQKDKILLNTKTELGEYGLGTSAAVTVATIEALSKLFGVKLSSEELFKLCYRVVLSVQGKASGFDVAASIYGGTVYFDGQTQKSTLLFSKPLPIITIFSGTKGETVRMIDRVAELRKRSEDMVADILGDISQLVKQAKIVLEKSNWSNLGKLMDSNHQLLVKLGVSNSNLDRLVDKAKRAGAYGAKLSGAGGGDCVIALYPRDKKEAIIDVIEKIGGQIIDLKTSAKGIRN